MKVRWLAHLKYKYYITIISKVSKIINQNIRASLRKQDSHNHRCYQVRSYFGSDENCSVPRGKHSAGLGWAGLAGLGWARWSPDEKGIGSVLGDFRERLRKLPGCFTL